MILVRVPSDVTLGCPPAVSVRQIYLRHMKIYSGLTQNHQSSESRNHDCRSRLMQMTSQHHQAASIFDRL
ncbi:hypothetical protein Plhal710r2_c057g0166111 [Plasmopara halstedii]